MRSTSRQQVSERRDGEIRDRITKHRGIQSALVVETVLLIKAAVVSKFSCGFTKSLVKSLCATCHSIVAMVSQDRLSRESSAQVHVYRRSEMLLTVTRKHEFLDKCAELETKGKNWETRNFL